MPAYYVETSAFFKRYRREPGSDVVTELFDGRRAGEHFATSYLTALEMRSIAERMRRGRLLRPAQYRRVLHRLVTDLADGDLRLLPLDDSVVDEALGLLSDYPLRAPDALHFASALRVRQAVGPADFYLVSGDKDLGDAVRRHPVQLLDPEHAGAVAYLRGLR